MMAPQLGSISSSVAPSAQDFAAKTGRNTVTDVISGTVEIITPPARGIVVPRGDGRLTINLNDVATAEPIPFTYARTVGGNTQEIAATINPQIGAQTGGWRKPAYYLPEVDANDDLVIEPGERASCYLVKPGGLTWETIRDERDWPDSIGGVANNIRQNPQWGYGASDALALDMQLALVIMTNYQLYMQRSPWLLFKSGETYPGFDSFGGAQQTIEAPGESPLHPIVIGSYGAGAKPYFQGNGPQVRADCSFIAITGIAYGRTMSLAGRRYIIADNIFADYAWTTPQDAVAALVLQGSDGTTYDGQAFGAQAHRHTALRRLNIQNVVIAVPSAGAGQAWNLGNDRASPYYIGVGEDGLVEKVFTGRSGWADDYAQDGVGNGMIPGDRSHGQYFQSNMGGMTVRHVLTIKPQFNVMQVRTGGIVRNVFGYKANSGVLIGATITAGNWSLADQIIQVGAGLKQYVGGPTVVAEGMTIQQPDLRAIRCGQFNSGAPEYFAAQGGSEIANGPKLVPLMGQQYRADSFEPALVDAATVNGSYATGDEQNYAVANWVNVPDKNVTAAQAAAIDALSVETWLDAYLGATGSTEADFEAFLDAHATPWIFEEILGDYWLTPLGLALPKRVNPQTCVFRPPVGGKTPGMRADIREDWTTQDMPGDVAGDSIDLDGHEVWWNQTPKAAIDDLAFGKGGALRMLGGALRPATLTVDDDGNDLSMDGGSKCDLPGYDGVGRLAVTVDQSRWLNSGTVTGNVSITSRRKSKVVLAESGGSFTVSDGETLTPYGTSAMGFDGYDGGNAALTVQAGGTLDFRVGGVLVIKDILATNYELIGYSGPNEQYATDFTIPEEGATFTGQTSGAQARFWDVVEGNIYNGVKRFFAHITDPTATFTFNEALHSDKLTMRDRFPQDAGFFANAASYTPGPPFDLVPGKICEVITGRGPQIGDLPAGFDATGRTAAPDVNSQVTLEAGSIVLVSTAGLAPGEYNLIEVDSLTDNGAILPPGVTVVGNRLVLTIV